jgi:hypothetical protein
MTGFDLNPAISSTAVLASLDTALDGLDLGRDTGLAAHPLSRHGRHGTWPGFIDAADCERAASEND